MRLLDKFAIIAAFIIPVCLITACEDDDDLSVSEIPGAVKLAFNKMYPGASGVEWEKNGTYFVADFNQRTFDNEAWFGTDGTWAMTETDYGSMVNQLPLLVVNAFNRSQYGTWIVDDAELYQKPIDSFCMIVVETEGLPEIALIYDTFGNLINKVQYDDFDITPNTSPETISWGN